MTIGTRSNTNTLQLLQENCHTSIQNLLEQENGIIFLTQILRRLNVELHGQSSNLCHLTTISNLALERTIFHGVPNLVGHDDNVGQLNQEDTNTTSAQQGAANNVGQLNQEDVNTISVQRGASDNIGELNQQNTNIISTQQGTDNTRPLNQEHANNTPAQQGADSIEQQNQQDANNTQIQPQRQRRTQYDITAEKLQSLLNGNQRMILKIRISLRKLLRNSTGQFNNYTLLPPLPIVQNQAPNEAQILHNLFHNMNNCVLRSTIATETMDRIIILTNLSYIQISLQINQACEVLTKTIPQLKNDFFNQHYETNRNTTDRLFNNMYRAGNRLIRLHNLIGLSPILIKNIFTRRCLEMNTTQFDELIHFITLHQEDLIRHLNQFQDIITLIDTEFEITQNLFP